MKDELSDLRELDLPFNVDEVDPQCHKCVRNQLKKYNKFVTKDGNSLVGKFVVPCKGIKKNPVNPALKPMFTDEEWEDLEAISDIVKWSKKYLTDEVTREPWTARDYQAYILRCSSRRKALRIGRRSGKTTLVCIEILYYFILSLLSHNLSQFFIRQQLNNCRCQIFCSN